MRPARRSIQERVFQSGGVRRSAVGHFRHRRTRHHHRTGDFRHQFVAGAQHQSEFRAAASGIPRRFHQHANHVNPTGLITIVNSTQYGLITNAGHHAADFGDSKIEVLNMKRGIRCRGDRAAPLARPCAGRSADLQHRHPAGDCGPVGARQERPPITNLKKEDVEVLEDGVKQDLACIRVAEARRRAADAPFVRRSKAPMTIEEKAAAARSRRPNRSVAPRRQRADQVPGQAPAVPVLRHDHHAAARAVARAGGGH